MLEVISQIQSLEQYEDKLKMLNLLRIVYIQIKLNILQKHLMTLTLLWEILMILLLIMILIILIALQQEGITELLSWESIN